MNIEFSAIEDIIHEEHYSSTGKFVIEDCLFD